MTNISGYTEYSQSSSKSLNTKLDIGYKLELYEPIHKKWIIYLNGIINPEYDHFGNEFKTNTFTTIGIDF